MMQDDLSAKPQRSHLAIVVSWSLWAVVSFHLAYEFAIGAPVIILFFLSLLQLAQIASARETIYFGWIIGLCIYGPQLFFFWSIFHQAAIFLWLILATWLALYLLLQRFALARFGVAGGFLTAPFLWMGIEYYRSEMYPLRFSWLNAGYLSPSLCHWAGMYGAGFVAMIVAGLFALAINRRTWRPAAMIGAISTLAAFYCRPHSVLQSSSTELAVAGVQFEESSNPLMLKALDELSANHPETQMFVLSEYSFLTPVPQEFKSWCVRHQRWLVAGGKQYLDAAHSQYRNTAFVIDPHGDEVFEQAKSQPIQFFDDGLAAERQAVWKSPWGKIGLCICYDLSYTRVTDGLIRQGAQMLIVPTMDVQDWGLREHLLHARVAPARAAEYGIPIFRLCSSGVSEAVSSTGEIQVTAPFPGQGKSLAATFKLPAGPGHLPLDRLLVWPCIACVVLVLGWCGIGLLGQVIQRLSRRDHPRSREGK